jgi:hypothetical protein
LVGWLDAYRAVANLEPIFNTIPSFTVTNSGKLAENRQLILEKLCSAIILS